MARGQAQLEAVGGLGGDVFAADQQPCAGEGAGDVDILGRLRIGGLAAGGLGDALAEVI